MIEWLSSALGMRFYYWTGLSWLILLPVYVIGAALITLLWWWLGKRMKRSSMVIIPLYVVLAIAPWVEELWIAWNFGRLCRKDAGIFVYKTVEAEGFYDATAGMLKVYTPVPQPAADHYEKGGFRFYELSLSDPKGGPSRVVHYEKVNGVWTPSILDQPTARYHYRWPHLHTPVAHKVVKHERLVIDSTTDEVLGRDLEYGRKAPWFFIGLDRPLMLCPTHNPLAKYGAISNLTLIPTRAK